jgi:hypothetical protein
MKVFLLLYVRPKEGDKVNFLQFLRLFLIG